MEKGFFGSMFDLDNDGKLDIIEQSLDFAAFVELTSDECEDEDDD